jgi:hypothetical protein
MVAGLAAPLLLKLDGFLALQWRILGAMVGRPVLSGN